MRGGAGGREDIHGATDSILGGTGLAEVAISHADVWVRYYRGLESLRGVWLKRNHQRSPPIHVYYLFGPPRTGKSEFIDEQFKEGYRVPRPNSGAVYFDQYDGEKVMVFEDFYSWVYYDLILKICDPYKLILNTKHSSTACLATTIVFTSNDSPWQLYPDRRNKQAFIERINEVWYFGKKHLRKLRLLVDRTEIKYTILLTYPVRPVHPRSSFELMFDRIPGWKIWVSSGSKS